MPDALEEARDAVAAVIDDDVQDAAPDEDLRDYGLDSIRLMSVLGTLHARGVEVALEDVAGAPSLRGLASAIAQARA